MTATTQPADTHEARLGLVVAHARHRADRGLRRPHQRERLRRRDPGRQRRRADHAPDLRRSCSPAASSARCAASRPSRSTSRSAPSGSRSSPSTPPASASSPGPSGGYLISFPLAAALAGFLVKYVARDRRTRALVVFACSITASILVIHVLGIVGMKLYFDVSLREAVTYDMPFWIGDVVKTSLVAMIAAEVHRAFPQLLQRALTSCPRSSSTSAAVRVPLPGRGEREILAPTTLTLTEQRVASSAPTARASRPSPGCSTAWSARRPAGCWSTGSTSAREGAAVRRLVGFCFTDPAAQLVMPTCVEDVELSLRRTRQGRRRPPRAGPGGAGRPRPRRPRARLASTRSPGGQRQLLALAGVLAHRAHDRGRRRADHAARPGQHPPRRRPALRPRPAARAGHPRPRPRRPLRPGRSWSTTPGWSPTASPTDVGRPLHRRWSTRMSDLMAGLHQPGDTVLHRLPGRRQGARPRRAEPGDRGRPRRPGRAGLPAGHPAARGRWPGCRCARSGARRAACC